MFKLNSIIKSVKLKKAITVIIFSTFYVITASVTFLCDKLNVCKKELCHSSPTQ